MSHENIAEIVVATTCAVCNRPLTDAESIEAGMGPDCRQRYGYAITVDPEARKEANAIVHAVAVGFYEDNGFVEKARRLEAIGFKQLARELWFKRRRQYAPRYGHVKWAKGPPAPSEELQDTDDNTPAEIEVVASEPTTAIATVELPTFTLTEGQSRGLEMIHRARKKMTPEVCFLVGYAGTGKTSLLRVVAKEVGRPVIVTPTGKAALRVKEATGLNACTVHRWLYKAVEDPRTGAVTFVRRRADEIDVPPSRIVLFDEGSMIGPEVWNDVWATCQLLNLKLVVIGDSFQLPPVQNPNAAPFSVLTPEFAASLKAERVEMTEVLRQALDSPVVRASMALRSGEGVRAFRELTHVGIQQFASVAVATHQQNGVVICHRNVTRHKINIGMRTCLGIQDEQPQLNEPLLVLKNTYEVGLVNGEAVSFPGWIVPPTGFERVKDRYSDVEEHTRFGAVMLSGKHPVTISLEELHGRLTVSTRAISYAAQGWARVSQLYLGDKVAPHLHCNLGYSYTAHKSQGSAWPYVLVVIEPSVRLNEEDGRRWAYTSITRAKLSAAVYFGNV